MLAIFAAAAGHTQHFACRFAMIFEKAEYHLTVHTSGQRQNSSHLQYITRAAFYFCWASSYQLIFVLAFTEPIPKTYHTDCQSPCHGRRSVLTHHNNSDTGASRRAPSPVRAYAINKPAPAYISLLTICLL